VIDQRSAVCSAATQNIARPTNYYSTLVDVSRKRDSDCQFLMVDL